MKSIIKGVLILVLIVLVTWYVTVFHTEVITHKGQIIEHNTTSDRTGSIDYYTIAVFEDGYVRSMRGLDYYVMPIGSTVTYKERRFK